MDEQLFNNGPFTSNTDNPRTLTEQLYEDLLVLSNISKTEDGKRFLESEIVVIETLSRALRSALTSYPSEKIFPQGLVFIVEDPSRDPTAIIHPLHAYFDENTVPVQSDPNVKAYMRAVMIRLYPESNFAAYTLSSEEGRMDPKLIAYAMKEIRELNKMLATAFPKNKGIKLMQNVLANLFE